jgi:hypothetical protein
MNGSGSAVYGEVNMKQLIIWCLVIGLFGSTYGQTADSDSTKHKGIKHPPVQTVDELLKQVKGGKGTIGCASPPKVAYINVGRVIQGGVEGYFNVRCEFITLPAPLKVAIAKLIFVVSTDVQERLLQDWVIEFTTSDIAVDWLSNRELVWAGPKKDGDVITTQVEFIPLESGQFGFDFGVRSQTTVIPMRIQWHLDENEKLLSLDSPSWSGERETVKGGAQDGERQR